MKFNRDYLEQNGKVPNHSYYCWFCLGYHVTSNPNKTSKRVLAERDKKEIDRMIDAVKKKERYLKNKKVVRKKDDKQ